MTLYRKQGRKYVPVAEEWTSDHIQHGCHLVVSKPGLKTIRYNIQPHHACLQAAFERHRDKLGHWYLEARAGRQAGPMVIHPSPSAVVDAIFDALLKAEDGE